MVFVQTQLLKMRIIHIQEMDLINSKESIHVSGTAKITFMMRKKIYISTIPDQIVQIMIIKINF